MMTPMIVPTLEKMQIFAFSNDGFSVPAGNMTVQFNPGTYNHGKKNKYTSTPVIGGAEVQRFGSQESETLSFEFLFDNTVISPTFVGGDVKTQVKNLVKLVYIVNGTSHKPNNILLSWGNLQFKCFCESLDVEYTHFNPAGIPVRAKVKASFKEKLTHKQFKSKTQPNSPDMTHHKVISAGVNITSVANEIYKDPSYYIELASFNGLDTFRGLKQGTEITAPPLKTSDHE